MTPAERAALIWEVAEVEREARRLWTMAVQVPGATSPAARALAERAAELDLRAARLREDFQRQGEIDRVEKLIRDNAAERARQRSARARERMAARARVAS